MRVGTRKLFVTALIGLAACLSAATGMAAGDDASPWGVASGSEWFGEHPRFNPMLRDAGVGWLRGFPEWQAIQPKQGEWNWESADKLVASARANGLGLVGGFWYFAPWASADGGTRRCPIKDIRYWRDYVKGVVSRYKGDVRYWEVWNEFDGSFSIDGSPAIYAELVREAYDAAKSVDPNAKIGMSVANVNVGFLDAAIKAGAAGHFDFVCVHPYENLGAAMDGGEPGFLSLGANLRRMLAANGQRKDIGLWITEIGVQSSVKPDAQADERQADALAKAYVLSLASGFSKVCWFEARGPAYGAGTDFGLIREDWTPRPSYRALKTLTTALGREPKYVGWVNLSGCYGFVFNAKGKQVLAAWAPVNGERKVKFATPVKMVDLLGGTSTLAAGREIELTRRPTYFVGIPGTIVREAKANASKPFPWGGDYSKARSVRLRLGAVNVDEGVSQMNPSTTATVVEGNESWRRTDFSVGSEGRYVYFRVDPRFVPFGTHELTLTVQVRRTAPEKDAGMILTYESMSGYKGTPEYRQIPADGEWHELSWRVTDANFVGGWGWSFRIDAVGSPNEFMVREARVSK